MRQAKKIHPALKHGAYAATALLPGEDPAAFDKLLEGLIAELAPTGALEEDIVSTIARLVWRKQNLATYRIAAFAHNRLNAITHEKRWQADHKLQSQRLEFLSVERSDERAREEVRRAADAEAREELGDKYELIEIGAIATLDYSMKELALEDRLDATIDRCMKRLLLLRGLKSIAPAAQIAPAPRARKS
jgi:hypothetical protein